MSMNTNGLNTLKFFKKTYCFLTICNTLVTRDTLPTAQKVKGGSSSTVFCCFPMMAPITVGYVVMHLLALQEVQSLLCLFPAPVLESAISPRCLETFNYRRVTRKVMGRALDFFQRAEENQLFSTDLMGQGQTKMKLLFDCLLCSPLISLMVAPSPCPLIGSTR